MKTDRSFRYEPPHTWDGTDQWIVRGEDSEGVWYLGTGDRKVEAIARASHYTAQSSAERAARRFGGDAIQIRWRDTREED